VTSAPPPAKDVVLVTREAELRRAATRLGERGRVAIDIESNGLFAYRAKLCVVQLAAQGEVVVADPLAVSMDGLRALLESDVVAKVVHDVAFDARILAEEGIHLTNVQDTSLAARMLGRTATGLASLLASELGVPLDKKMQHHDWAARPLDRRAIAYLAGDVIHLEALADKLFSEVDGRGIRAAVDEETRYRLAQARESVDAADPRPPWVRLKGADRAPAEDLPILRRVAELRESRARELDVPPYKVLAPDVLFAIARAKPQTMEALARIRGATQGRGRALARDVLDAVADPGEVPDDERAMLVRPRLPSGLAKLRRAREQRLTKWRKDEAKKRGVDEQVVLPGHCLQDLADVPEATLEAVAAVPGIGAFRVERDGAALVAALAAQKDGA
jgi:ribonuclease D